MYTSASSKVIYMRDAYIPCQANGGSRESFQQAGPMLPLAMFTSTFSSNSSTPQP